MRPPELASTPFLNVLSHSTSASPLVEVESFLVYCCALAVPARGTDCGCDENAASESWCVSLSGTLTICSTASTAMSRSQHDGAVREPHRDARILAAGAFRSASARHSPTIRKHEGGEHQDQHELGGPERRWTRRGSRCTSTSIRRCSLRQVATAAPRKAYVHHG